MKQNVTERISLLIATFILSLFLAGTACRSAADVSGPGNANADVFVDQISFDGKIIDAKIRAGTPPGPGPTPAPTPSLLPSEEFWFSNQDDTTIVYGWDQVTMRLRDAGTKACNYAIISSGCRECHSCDGTCNDGTAGLTVPSPNAIATVKKAPPNGQFTTIKEIFSPLLGCRNQHLVSTSPLEFPAEDNTVYLFSHEDFFGTGANFAQRTIFFKTHIVANTEKLKKDTQRYIDTASPAVLRYKYEIGIRDGRLSENFSQRLRVSKVRVLLATRDKSTGEVMYREDSAALLKARPSRIMFLTDVRPGDVNNTPSETTNRCYFDMTAEDGNFDIQSCKTSLTTGPRRFDLTPAYVTGDITKTITWFVEYNTADGLAAAPVFEDDPTHVEFPALEFTFLP